MNTLFKTLVATLTLGASLSAFAGPDWHAIEQARKHAYAQPIKAEHRDAAQPFLNDHDDKSPT